MAAGPTRVANFTGGDSRMQHLPQQNDLLNGPITSLHRISFDNVDVNYYYYMYYADMDSDYVVKVLQKGRGSVRLRLEYIRQHRSAGGAAHSWRQHGETVVLFERDITFYRFADGGRRRKVTRRRRTRRARH